jgi:hypothetical protein
MIYKTSRQENLNDYKNKMKWCKAWPEACATKVESLPGTFSETLVEGPTESLGPLVWPKQLIDETVEQSVFQILSQTFPETKQVLPVEAPVIVEKEPVEVEVPAESKPKTVTYGSKKLATVVSTEPIIAPSVRQLDLTPVWVSIGVLAFLVLVLIWGLMQRVQNLESWLHGRLVSRP